MKLASAAEIFCEKEAWSVQGIVYDSSNERIKVYDARPEQFIGWNDCAVLPGLAGKVIAYARPGQREGWQAHGFRFEAVIRGYFRNGEDAWIWSGFPRPQRGLVEDPYTLDEVLALALVRSGQFQPGLPPGYTSSLAESRDMAEVAQLLQATFPEYPSPLDEATLLSLLEARKNCYRLVRNPQGLLLAVASAELDWARQSAEMTDCATRPEEQGKGLMANLLWQLQHDVERHFGMTTIYTMARSNQPGMNCAFSKLGYQYAGRLVNNCRMPAGWESMNLWNFPRN